MYVRLVLARRPLRRARHSLRPGPRAVHEGDPPRQVEERSARRGQDCRLAARRTVAPGLRLSQNDAGHARPPEAAFISGTAAGRLAPPPGQHQQPIQPPGLEKEACLSRPPPPAEPPPTPPPPPSPH